MLGIENLAQHLKLQTGSSCLQVRPANDESITALPAAGLLTVSLEGLDTQTNTYILPALVEGVDIILGESWLTSRAQLDYVAMHCTLKAPDGAIRHSRPVPYVGCEHTLSPAVALPDTRRIEVISARQLV